MSQEDSDTWDYSEKFTEYIKTVIARNNNTLNPLTTRYGKDIFHDFKDQIIPDLTDRDPTTYQSNLEFSSLQTFSEFLLYAYQESEEEQKGQEEIEEKSHASDNLLFKIGLLLDLVLLLKKEKIAFHDIAILLTAKIIRGLNAKMLLRFMDALSLRADQLKELDQGQKLEFRKANGVALNWNTYSYYSKPLMISINFQLYKTKKSFDESLSLLKYKLLRFSSEIFPSFDEPLTNKSWKINNDYTELLPTRSKAEIYNSYLILQKLCRDPSLASKEKSLDIILDRLSDYICKIESRQAIGTENFINSVEKFERREESNEYNQSLKRYYQEKSFSPNLNITQLNIVKRLEQDQYARRSILIQILLLLNILISRINPRDRDPTSKFQLPGFPGKFIVIRTMIQNTFQSIDKSLMYLMGQIKDISEQSWIVRKVNDFKFIFDLHEAFEITDEFSEDLAKRKKLPGKYFSALGSPEITKHWRITIGLDKLKKLQYEYDLQGLPTQIEKLYNEAKEAPEKSSINTWRAYRMIRKSNLSKFKQIDQFTGLEGYFNADLKSESAAKIAAIKEAEKLKEDELAKQREELRKAQEEEKTKARLQEEIEASKKRKRDDEEFLKNKKSANSERPTSSTPNY